MKPMTKEQMFAVADTMRTAWDGIPITCQDRAAIEDGNLDEETKQKFPKLCEDCMHHAREVQTKRAVKLKSEAELYVGSAATEHAGTEIRIDDALAETPRSSTQVAKESAAAEHASAEFCIEAALDETLRRIKAIHGDSEILVRVVDHACHPDTQPIQFQ